MIYSFLACYSLLQHVSKRSTPNGRRTPFVTSAMRWTVLQKPVKPKPKRMQMQRMVKVWSMALHSIVLQMSLHRYIFVHACEVLGSLGILRYPYLLESVGWNRIHSKVVF